MNLKILIMLSIVLLLVGCTSTSNLINKTKSKFNGEQIQNVTIKPACPECVCPIELDAVVYYFDNDIYQGFSTFLGHSDDFLDCAFIRLDTDRFTNLLIRKHIGLNNVRILFDKDSTMDCTSACIPYSISQYNELYGSGLSIRLVKDLHESFCISDDGLFITTSLLDDYESYDSAFMISSPGLEEIYKDRFNKLWGGSE